jgi:radical SAM superfamily enzyme YgiQ (UPF0313 family)
MVASLTAMNALLLYPEFPDTFWSFKHALRFVRKKASLPPLGLLTIAALLPDDWDMRLVDANVRELEDEDLEWADCVLVSAMTVQRNSAHALIARCKATGLTVVAGGPLFSVEHEQFDAVDHFVLNEAECTLPLFLADLARGEARRVYASDEFADLASTPAPRWELIDMDQYVSMNIQYSRGCPFNCDFCNVTTLFGHRPRVKSVDQIINELDIIYEHGWRGQVFFVDDNLIGNKRGLKNELLPALIEWQKTHEEIAFNTQASINLADDQTLMDSMVEAGFNAVFVGIETPDETSLVECSKSQNLKRDLLADVRAIHRAGMQVQGGFIVGFDNDAPSIFRRQIEFIQQSGIVTAMVGMLQALPGTRLFDRMQHEGRLIGTDSGDNADGTTNFLPRMGLDTLNEGYKEIMRHIYSSGPYYERLKVFLSEYAPRRSRQPIKTEKVAALFRSFFWLGMVGEERRHFWKLLAWTLRHHRESFPVAVTLAVYGYHFRKTSEMHLA